MTPREGTVHRRERRDSADVRYLLINPPLTDPTAAYHSISYLVGAAASHGYSGYTCLDANIAALNFMARPEEVEGVLEHCARLREDIEGKALERDHRLSRREQLLYRYALKAVGLRPDAPSRAIAVLRDSERFYDYAAYRQATVVLRRWLHVLSTLGFPGQFYDFNFYRAYGGSLAKIDDLVSASFQQQFCAPFARYLRGPLTDELRAQPWDLVGLSISYTSQLPYGMFLCQMVRELCPDAVICVGGTDVTDVVKYLHVAGDVWRLFPTCDAIVVGEGESAFVEILDHVAGAQALPAARPGILRPGNPSGGQKPQVRYEDMANLALPRYDVWDWDQYWSPEPVVLYSPTRGCYWNKCTFCDYGLNTDGPTSPARTKPIPDVIEELRQITALSRTLYFSVDAIPPAYLRQLARAIADAGLDVRWSAELRLERSLLKGLAEELKAAGCVAISFGYESGSQRVLDLINKGVSLAQVPALLRELHRVGIAAQMMGFVGFPSETPAEAEATFALLVENREYWTIADIGTFVLTPGSMVAKRPDDFGIRHVEALRGDDIVRYQLWTLDDGVRRGPWNVHTPETERAASRLSSWAERRPFVGGGDSSHTILYYERFGPRLVAVGKDDQPPEMLISTLRYYTPLPDAERLVSVSDLEAFHLVARERGEAADCAQVTRWLDDLTEPVPVRGPATGSLVDILPTGDFLTVSEQQLAVEEGASAAYHLVKDLLLRKTTVG